MPDLLAQKSSSSSSSSSKGSMSKDDPWGIGRFCIGCFLVPFSLVLLWKNEKKVVTFAKCMDLGRKNVRTVDPEDVDGINEFELVHLTGTTTNSTMILDNDLGIVARNSYRLKRKVEMYQWREICHEKDGKKTFTYDHAWSETPINSNSFEERHGHENPSNVWPFQSHTFDATTIMLGMFKLRADQVLRLGRASSHKVSLEEEGGL